MPFTRLATASIIAAALTLSACAAGGAEPTTKPAPSRAVIIVSGGGTITPFTTPTQACSSAPGFLSAGNTATALRDFLLEQGKQVYTAPTMSDWGVVSEPDPSSFAPFKGCPTVLPEVMTIMSAGDIDAGGERLARFLNYLYTDYGVTDVDLVGHSNGGLWSRAAINILKATNSPVTIRSLVTMGTPHVASVPGRYTWGEITLADCMGVQFCIDFNKVWIEYAGQADKGLNREDTLKYLDGPDGWNNAQGNALDGIPVTLMAGTYFTAMGGDPTIWPYDGITSRYSGWAADVSDAIMPHRSCWAAALTHSIFVSDFAKIDWQTALTWNTDALAEVNRAINESDTALSQPNRQGCGS